MKKMNFRANDNQKYLNRKPCNEVVKVINQNNVDKEIRSLRMDINIAQKYFDKLGAKIKSKIKGPIC